MSERPTTEGSKFSRLRMPVGRLRDLPIWSKLGLIMVVPTIATIIVGTTGLVQNISAANDADDARTLARLSAEAGAVIHELQSERAAGVLLAGASDKDIAKQGFERQVPITDAAIEKYRQTRRAVGDLDGDAESNLSEAENRLNDVTGLRNRIKGATEVPQSAVKVQYGFILVELSQVRQTALRLTSDAKLNAAQQAAAALAERKAALNDERIVILQVLAGQQNGGVMTPALRQEYANTQASQVAASDRFSAASTQSERELLGQTLSGSGLRSAVRFRGQIAAVVAATGANANGGKLQFSAPEWDDAIGQEAALLRQVEQQLDERVVTAATGVRDDLRQTVLIQTALLLGMLLLAILFAWLVARSMARSLRELRHGALTVAQYGLPQAVARLREPSLTLQSTPDHVARQIAEPLPVRSRDEFGQVTEAFNAVHLEAVRTAAEQAQLRASVATMFVNLARRSQILVDRLIGHLDRLERGEEDPDRLAELFQLDHLATRMRRNDENLLVLAGADSSRVQREPAPLMDVLRAAQSEVEHYTRIEFGMIDRDVEIAAHSVNDMVHLIAELLDNATAFSPPDSAVVVEARRVGERCVLLVEDRGIGISHDQLRELNEKLGNPPAVDVAVSRMMGLVVVARLAARHGVRVELRPARERGTVADITLPAGVLVQRPSPGRSTGDLPLVGAGAERPMQAPPSRPAMGMPSTMALEGGDRAGGPRERTPSAFSSGSAFSPATPPPPTRGSGPSSLSSSSFGRGPATPPEGPTHPLAPTSGGPGQPPRNPGIPGAQPPVFSGPSGGPGGGPGRPGAPGAGRGLPPWSDLTGATAANGNGSHGSGQEPGSLPQRRAGDNWATGDPADTSGSIPRQRPADTPPQTSGAESPGLPTRPPGPAGGLGGPPATGPTGLPTRPAPAGPAGGLGGPQGEASRAGLAGGPSPTGPAGLPTRPTAPGAPATGPGGLPVRPVSGRAGQPDPAQPGADQPAMGQPGQSGMGQPGFGQPAMGRPGFGQPAQPAPPAWPPAPGASTTPPAQPAQPAQNQPAPSAAAPSAPAPAQPVRPEPVSNESGFSPALDMTAEIPRVRDDWAPAANGQSGSVSGGGDALSGPPRQDQTMELPPIFRDVESAWFRTRRPSPMRALTNGSNGAAPAAPDAASAPARPVSGPPVSGAPISGAPISGTPVSGTPAQGPARGPAQGPATPSGPSAMPTGAPWSPPSGAPVAPASPLPPRTPASQPRTPASPLPPRTPAPAVASDTAPPVRETTSAPADRSTSDESVTWRTAADDGWRAAEALGQDRDFNVTEGGLPKRVPMSQLVPGGIDRATTASHRRTPEAVRGLLSAYHRGVQRGRSQSPSATDSRTPQPTQAGPSNPQGGKEREA